MAQAERLLEVCKPRLTSFERTIIEEERSLLIEKKLLSQDVISTWSAKELVEYGFSPGAAAALKKAFPSTSAAGEGGCTMVHSSQ